MAAIDDPKLQSSNFMKFLQQLSNGELKVDENNNLVGEAGDWASEYEAKEKEGVDWASEYQHMGDTSEHWVDEFSDETSMREFENLEKVWEAAEKQAGGMYEFAENNPFKDHPQPFVEAQSLFDQGLTALAALAAEAAILQIIDGKGDTSQLSSAWLLLGHSHAECDNDSKAISALSEAVHHNPTNLQALMALAVSCTNDYHKYRALNSLSAWLENHPVYKDIPVNNDGPFEMTENLVDRFIRAAQLRAGDPDADVQIALGLLYNLSFEYQKAIECFKCALQQRPEDYSLWNKLGATLANSGHSEEALGAYFRALELRPSYVRLRVNIGISYMALKQYNEAASYFLSALEVDPSAGHVWSNLRMLFTNMQRQDLLEKATGANPRVADFRDDFDF
jgi:peroxin-5